VLARIIIGLGVSLICFAVAGRRFFWLSKLIRSGKPAPRRWQGFRKVTEAEVVEVAGQKKLLKWTVPGLAHFFTMWGFTVLFTTIIEAYGGLFNRDFHIPFIGQSNWLAFTEDFFSVAVLISLVVFSVIRIKNAPARKDRESRFYGSHLGAAWIVLGLIFLVIATLLMYRAGQINAGHFPFPRTVGAGMASPTDVVSNQLMASPWAFASQTLAHWLAPLGTGVNSVIEVVFLLANVGVIAGFMVFVSYSSTCTSSLLQSTLEFHAALADLADSTRPPTWTWKMSPKTQCSVLEKWRTSPGSRCSTSQRAPNVVVVSQYAQRGQRASR